MRSLSANGKIQTPTLRVDQRKNLASLQNLQNTSPTKVSPFSAVHSQMDQQARSPVLEQEREQEISRHQTAPPVQKVEMIRKENFTKHQTRTSSPPLVKILAKTSPTTPIPSSPMTTSQTRPKTLTTFSPILLPKTSTPSLTSTDTTMTTGLFSISYTSVILNKAEEIENSPELVTTDTPPSPITQTTVSPEMTEAISEKFLRSLGLLTTSDTLPSSVTGTTVSPEMAEAISEEFSSSPGLLTTSVAPTSSVTETTASPEMISEEFSTSTVLLTTSVAPPSTVTQTTVSPEMTEAPTLSTTSTPQTSLTTNPPYTAKLRIRFVNFPFEIDIFFSKDNLHLD